MRDPAQEARMAVMAPVLRTSCGLPAQAVLDVGGEADDALTSMREDPTETIMREAATSVRAWERYEAGAALEPQHVELRIDRDVSLTAAQVVQTATGASGHG